MTETVISQGVSGSPARRAATALGLVALAASALFGGNLLGLRDRLLGLTAPARSEAVSRVADEPGAAPAKRDETALRSQPWWQGVGTLEGVGAATTRPLRIDGGAFQWRLKWSCQSGHLVVQAPGRPRPLVDARCPGNDTAYATQSGNMSLRVKADGPWKLEVEQQLDVPLDEPPLPLMAAPGTAAVATGSFYRVDQVGQGSVTVYRLADNTHALRLDDFYVTPNRDLEIRLSPLPAPRSTDQFTSAPSALVAMLDVTAGSMNFTVPPGVDPRQYRSVVIWCEQLHTAYAAASLTPAA